MARVLRITMTWLALMTALTVVGSAVSAHADEASHWSKQRTGPRLTQPVRSLSCPSLHSCTAIGGYGSTLHFDGHAWGAATTADRDLMAVSSVSCPTPSFCGAAGGRTVVVEEHGHWSRVHAVAALLEDVSCPSTQWCLAVGRDGHTIRYDEGAWHPGPRAPEWLQSVSCTSRGFCMAEAVSGTAYRFDGRRWHRAGDIRSAAGGPNGLSCGSPTLCLAAGGSRTAARWDGRRWVRHAFDWGMDESGTSSCGVHYCELLTNAHAVEWHRGWGTVTDVPAGDAVTDSPLLSCSSRGRCVAVTAGSPAMTLSLKNGTWRTGAYPDSPDVLQEVSCPTTTFCMGLQHGSSARMLRDGHWSEVAMPDDFRFGFNVVCTSPAFCMAESGLGETATWDGTSWSAGARLGTGALIFDCASATYCVGTDNTEHTETWDGAGWTAGPAASVESISCPAPDDCWAGGGESEVVHFDGAAWSPPVTIAPTGVDGFNTITVRCASSTTCAAADQRGNVYIHQDGHWGRRTHLGGRLTSISALDCGSDSSCTATFGDVFDARETAHWNGSTWSETRALPQGYSGVLASLSCPTQKVCVGIDWNGTAWTRS